MANTTLEQRRGWGVTALACLLAAGLCMTQAGCFRSPEAKEASYLESGKRMVEKKDYARALIQFRNASKAMPKDAEPYYQAALVYLERREWKSAYGNFKKVAELNPKHQQAQLKLAELLALGNKENVEQAHQKIQDLIKTSPDSAEELDALAFTEFKLGNQQDAEKHLEEAFAKFPAHLTSAVSLARVKLARKDVAGAEDVLKKSAEQQPLSANAFIALGNFYLTTGKPVDGEKQFRRAVEIDPKSGPALLSLAVLQMRTGKTQEAEQSYRQLSALPDPQYRPYHAAFLAAQGKHDQAVAEFEKLYKQFSDDRTIRSYLVGEYMRTQKTGEAEKLISGAIKNSSKDVDARLVRAEMYLTTGRPDDAQKDLAVALHFRSDSFQAHYLMAHVHQAHGQATQQRQELGEVLRLRKDYMPARLQLARSLLAANSAQAALDVLDDKNVSPQQKNTLAYLVQRNWALLGVNQTAEARKEVDRGLAQIHAPDLLFQDALLKYGQKDYPGARAALVEALNKSPENLQFLRLLVATFAAEKKTAAAIPVVQQFAAQRPKSAPLQLFLADLLVANGQRVQARAALQASKAANPKFAPADLALAQLDMADGKLNDAARTLSGLLAQNAANIPARFMLAGVEEMRGDHTGAVNDYRKVIEAQPNSVAALNNLAFNLAEYANQPDEALKYAQKAAELAPEAPAVENTLGWVLYHKGLYSLALPHLERAADKEPSARRKCHVAMAYLKMGNQERGQKNLNAALKMDPNIPEIRTAQQMLDEMLGGR